MAVSDSTLLNLVDTAIQTLVADPTASYTINGRSWSAQDLDKLWTLKNRLEQRINRASRGMFAVGKFKRMQ